MAIFAISAILYANPAIIPLSVNKSGDLIPHPIGADSLRLAMSQQQPAQNKLSAVQTIAQQWKQKTSERRDAAKALLARVARQIKGSPALPSIASNISCKFLLYR